MRHSHQRKILDEQIPGYFDGGWDIVDEYIDDGRTGTSDDTRPAFLRLAADDLARLLEVLSLRYRLRMAEKAAAGNK